MRSAAPPSESQWFTAYPTSGRQAKLESAVDTDGAWGDCRKRNMHDETGQTKPGISAAAHCNYLFPRILFKSDSPSLLQLGRFYERVSIGLRCCSAAGLQVSVTTERPT